MTYINMGCGQTFLSPRALQNMNRQVYYPIYYPGYYEEEIKTVNMLKKIYNTKNDLLIITGTGTYGIEAGFRKTFTDYLDDVSTTYPGGNLLDMTNEAIYMSDPLGTHSKNMERGNPDKKDWYAFAGITLSFRLSNNTKGCDY